MSEASLRDSKILIVGAGTWGCSAALHLARRGYTSITVLDPHAVPSPISAGNDVNKILETGSFAGDDPDERYVSNKLLEAAIDGWQNDPVFKPYFHETGCIVAATTESAIAHLNTREAPNEARGWIRLESKEDFISTMPVGVLTGDFPGWTGWWKKEGAGWVHARKSMESAAKEAERLGVKFITGEDAGRVTGLIYDSSDVKGAITADSTQHLADRTILCAGANAATLFDMKDQLRPTAWTLAHIKMTPEEAKLYKDLPVLYNIELGFFMEPDEDNHELKFCDEHPGYVNWASDSSNTTNPRAGDPFSKHQIPVESEARCRTFLREVMPHLADRPFSFARICWCADTPNRAFLISKHPDYASLVLAVGASGHGFCHIPAIGGFIADALEDKLDEKLKRSFRWRPETAVDRDWRDLQGRFGPDGANRVLDFQEVTAWTQIPSQRA